MTEEREPAGDDGEAVFVLNGAGERIAHDMAHHRDTRACIRGPIALDTEECLCFAFLPMIRELTLKNFRAFRELHLTGLGRVNLLVGANNSGKTSVLEAVA